MAAAEAMKTFPGAPRNMYVAFNSLYVSGKSVSTVGYSVFDLITHRFKARPLK